MFQIKSNPHGHTCPPGGGGGKNKSKLAKTRWVADAILDWVRETPTIGPGALHGKLFDKYKINIPYMRIFYAKERLLIGLMVHGMRVFSCFTPSKMKWRRLVQGVL